jgi:hypothetical protein
MSAEETDRYLASVDEPADYTRSSRAPRFSIDAPLPAELVAALMSVQMRQAIPAC